MSCGLVDSLDARRAPAGVAHLLPPAPGSMDGPLLTPAMAIEQVMPDQVERLKRGAPDGEVAIAIQALSGPTPPQTATGLRAHREGGVWRVTAHVEEIADGAAAPRTVLSQTVDLSPADAQALDLLVDGPCLWRTPSVIAGPMAMRNGATAQSFDGPIVITSVMAGRRAWNGLQYSFKIGPPAEIYALLSRAAAGRVVAVDTRLGPAQ